MKRRQWFGRRTQALIGALLIGAFVLNPLAALAAPARNAPAQLAPSGQYTVGDCSQVDKQKLRDEIENHALAVVNGTSTPFNIDSLVERKWAELRMDAAVDAAVTEAVNNLGNQEGYLDKFISGWWGEKAQEYAERIANDAFSSPAFKIKLNELSTAIGAAVAQQVEGEFAEAASVALLCLKEYVGEQYSATLFGAFERSVQTDMQQVNLSVDNAPVIAAADEHNLALAGVGTILVTQLVYRLTQKLSEKIAQRVAGKVVGRVMGKAGSSLIPVAGWIIGIAMIAYDLWEGTQGALPQIQEALQSEEVKAKIREEIATAIKDDLPDQAALIALETSVSLVEQWQGFCSRYGDVCTVADQNPDFRSLLSLVGLDELDRLSQLVGWYMNQSGRQELDQAIRSGALEQLLALPDATVSLLVQGSRPADVTPWLELAGDRLGELVAYGVQRKATPAEFDARQLAALLSIKTAEGIDKLLTLAPQQRNELLTLPADTLQALAQNESATQLAVLANYLLTPAEQGIVPAAVADRVARGEVTVEQLVEPTAAVATNVPEVAEAAGAEGAAQAVGASTEINAPDPNSGLQQKADNDTIRRLSMLVLLAVVVVAAVAAFGYVRRRNRHSAR